MEWIAIHFGTTIDIDGDLLVVGAPQDDISGNQGRKCLPLLKRRQMDNIQKLLNSYLKKSKGLLNFGSSVAVNNLVIALVHRKQGIIGW